MDVVRVARSDSSELSTAMMFRDVVVVPAARAVPVEVAKKF